MADRRSIIVACRTGRGVLVDSETIGFLNSLYRTRKFYLLARVARHLKRTSQLTDRNRFELGFLVGRAGAELDNIALMDEGLRDAVLSEPFTPSITYQFADYRSRGISEMSALKRVLEITGDSAHPKTVAKLLRVVEDHGNGGVNCRVIGEPLFFAAKSQPSPKLPALHVLSVARATIRRRGCATFVFQDENLVEEASGPFLELLHVSHAREKLFDGDDSGFLELNGTSVLVADNYSGNNYAHWILDYMPRLFLCLRESREIHSIIGFQAFSKFHRQTIDLMLGRDAAIIELDRNKNIQTEHLLTLNNNNNAGVSANHPIHHASRYLIDAFSRFMRDAAVENSADISHRPRKIYISRQRSRRKIINAEEIEGILSHEGFEEVFLEDMDVASQIIMFSQAVAIFGLHGAGMSNIVFCNNGTFVYEYFLHGVGFSGFSQISASLELNYSASNFVKNSAMPYELNYGEDIYVEPARLLEWTRHLPPS